MNSMILIAFTAAIDISSILSLIILILKVAVGLGAVIFVHELGHFLVAKACGVKIEKFMIGFDIGGYKLAWRRGETLYGIGIVPLGGYVKMLGQDDDPAHIAEQMKKSEVSAASAEGVEVVGPKGEKYFVDRRSYLAKSVPQRMAIISAGVVMNVIFAFIFAVVAYGMGVPYYPSIVSETSPGSPAWRAGLETGDEIIQIGNIVNPTFTQLRGGVTLGDMKNGIPVVIKRAASGETQRITLVPEHGSGELATIGISLPHSLTLSKIPTIEGSVAANAQLVSPPASQLASDEAKFKTGDEVIRVGDEPVKSYRDYAAILAANLDQPLQITVRRPPAKAKDANEKSNAAGSSHELTFELPAQPMNRFGLVMNIGPISAIQEDSPAEEAGFKEGDQIELVDGRPMASGGAENAANSWDGLSLPDYAQRAAAESREIEFTIERPEGNTSESKQQTIRVAPIEPNMFHSFHPLGAPVAVDAVGIAYPVGNEVVGIAPGSPAAKAGLKVGDQITVAKVHFPPDSKGEEQDPLEVRFVAEKPGWLGRLLRSVFGGGETEPRVEPSWPTVVNAVQFAAKGAKVELTVKRSGDDKARTVTLEPTLAEGAYFAARGLNFELIERIRTAKSFGEQIQLGWQETTEALGMVFRFLQKLGTQVPLTALGGPGTIAMVAGNEASKGLPSFLVFLTMLSANLAVLNFLPIPLLDGGHLVFLAYEGIRRRPAPEKFVIAMHMVGFVFIIGLMMFVIGLDIQRIWNL
ncbi:MAG TPA: site-2 protease family protein [Lacipirellulaceae bacterium]|nr:site-2 protease family protein [Lacipirellulaceae bacterium]